MPARLVQVTLINSSDFPIIWQDDGRPHGFWQEPWYPSNIKNLKRGEQGTWRLESGGILTGVEGWALFKVDVPFASNVGSRTEFFRPWWARPYIGSFIKKVEYWNHDPRTEEQDHPGGGMAYVKDHGFAGMGDLESSGLFEFIAFGAFVPLTVPIVLNNETHWNHVAWVMEMLNTGTTSTLPLQLEAQGIIYAIAQNNDLLWFRHDGRSDGSFTWLDDNARKVGVGWDMKHVFYGGDGIIYAIDQNNDLLWFRHDGRSDGSFTWFDDNARKVGVGWDMKHVFYGGDSAIYAINQNNDLLWFRHDGRNDGSFRWFDNNARKVGVGWDMKHVFSG